MQSAKLFVLAICAIGLLVLFNNNFAKSDKQDNSRDQTEIEIYYPKLGDYPQKNGECFSTSTALQGRSDSLRCSVDSFIIDPCFKVNDKVICDTNPVEAGDEFELVTNKELPEDDGDYELDKRFSWGYQFEDGSTCFLIQGAAGSISTGEMYHYACDDNKVIIGDVDKSDDLWKAEVGNLADDNNQEVTERKTQSVILAWE